MGRGRAGRLPKMARLGGEGSVSFWVVWPVGRIRRGLDSGLRQNDG